MLTYSRLIPSFREEDTAQLDEQTSLLNFEIKS